MIHTTGRKKQNKNMLRGLKLDKSNNSDSGSSGKKSEAANNDADHHHHHHQQQQKRTMQRESWMLSPPPPPSGDNDGGGSRSSYNDDDDESGTRGRQPSARELNPYWKDGGDGLPTRCPSSSKPSVASVGDGGASWRARALRRMRERASLEGSSTTREEAEQRFAQELKRRREERRSERRGSSSSFPGGSGISSGSGTRGGSVSRSRSVGDGVRPRDRDTSPSASASYRGGNHSVVKDDGGGGGSSSQYGRQQWKRQRQDISDSCRSGGSAPAAVAEADIDIPTRTDAPRGRQADAAKDAGDIDERMNKLAAMAMKAQLMGNDERYHELNSELEMLRKQQQQQMSSAAGAAQSSSSSQQQQQPPQKEIVVLPEFDLRGRRIASRADYGNLGTSSAQPTDAQSVQRMFQEEIMDDTSQSSARSLYRDMTRSKRLGKDRSMDQEYDDMYSSGAMESFSSGDIGRKRRRDRRMDSRDTMQRQEQHVKRMQIREHLRQSSIFEKCHFCFGADRGSAVFKKHLVIALGEKCLLMLPPFGSLVEQHCVIAPLDHKLSLAHLDEDEQQEVQRFKQSLRRMFHAQKKDVLFMETVTPYNLRKQRHAYLECIPVPIQTGQEAPSFFKKAIMEADEEWSQNKKLIDTKGRTIEKVHCCDCIGVDIGIGDYYW